MVEVLQKKNKSLSISKSQNVLYIFFSFLLLRHASTSLAFIFSLTSHCLCLQVTDVAQQYQPHRSTMICTRSFRHVVVVSDRVRHVTGDTVC